MPRQLPAQAMKGTILGMLLLAAAGCAPDAWTPDSGFDAWTEHVGRVCYPNRIGLALVDQQFRRNDLFLDLTSRVYFKKITWEQYASAVNDAAYGDNDGALRCIRDNLPK